MRDNFIKSCLLRCMTLLLGLISMSACELPKINSPCNQYHAEENTSIPEYIKSIWPTPDSVFYLSNYRHSISESNILCRGVGAWILVFLVDIAPSDPYIVMIPERSELFINGNPVSRDYLEVGNDLIDAYYVDEEGKKIHIGTSAYEMSWTPSLSPGNHEARIVVTRNTGEVLEYSWNFYIINDSPLFLIVTILGIFVIVGFTVFYIVQRKRYK